MQNVIEGCQENDFTAVFDKPEVFEAINEELICAQVGGIVFQNDEASSDLICITENCCLLNEVLQQIDHPSCFENDLYVIPQDPETKAEQQTFCSNLLKNGVLAKLESAEQFYFLETLIETFLREILRLNFFFLGITSSIEVGSSNPSDFFFDDGSTENLDFIQDKVNGEFPWRADNEPNNNSGNEECVAFAVPDAGLIDLSCAVTARAICQGTCPFSSCLEDDLFVFVDEEKTFDSAQKGCIELFGGNLARVTSEEEHLFVAQLIRQSGVQLDNGVWIGVRAEEGLDSTIPSSFEFVGLDAPGSEFFKVNAGEFPWDPTFEEPSGLDENCVEISGTLDFWNDLRCDSFNRFVCRVNDADVCADFFEPVSTSQPAISSSFTDSPTTMDESGDQGINVAIVIVPLQIIFVILIVILVVSLQRSLKNYDAIKQRQLNLISSTDA